MLPRQPVFYNGKNRENNRNEKIGLVTPILGGAVYYALCMWWFGVNCSYKEHYPVATDMNIALIPTQNPFK